MHSHDAHGERPRDFGRAFAIGVALNAAFVVVEATYGVLADSIALIADASHNLGDVLGLAVAWGASILARRAPTARFTYGLRSTSILAALFNAAFLLIAVGAIAVEAVRRIFEPAPVAGATVIAVAAIGIAINTATALLFFAGRKGDLNIRAAFLHMATDAAVSAGVVVAGVIIVLTGLPWIDPAVSLTIALVIMVGTWRLLRESFAMSLHGVPAGVDGEAVRAYLAGLPGVAQVHDLHIWPMSTTETALTAHLVMPDGHAGDDGLARITDGLRELFAIAHATIQVERDGASCRLAPDHVV